jgi:hypothetical protein
VAEFDAVGQGLPVSWYRWVAGVCIVTALTVSFYIVLDSSVLRAILATLSVVGFVTGVSWILPAMDETVRERNEFNENLISLQESVKNGQARIPLPKAEFEPTSLPFPVISLDAESFELLVNDDQLEQLVGIAEKRDVGIARLLRQIARQRDYRRRLAISA